MKATNRTAAVRGLAALLTAAQLFAAGCTLRLVSKYDEEIDRRVTVVQNEVAAFLNLLERTAGKPEADAGRHTAFYDRIKADLSSIRMRATAVPKNEITVKQIAILEDQVRDLEELHRRGLKAEEIPPLRTVFDVTCTAILKLELAKKRGEAD